MVARYTNRCGMLLIFPDMCPWAVGSKASSSSPSPEDPSNNASSCASWSSTRCCWSERVFSRLSNSSSVPFTPVYVHHGLPVLSNVRFTISVMVMSLLAPAACASTRTMPLEFLFASAGGTPSCAVSASVAEGGFDSVIAVAFSADSTARTFAWIFEPATMCTAGAASAVAQAKVLLGEAVETAGAAGEALSREARRRRLLETRAAGLEGGCCLFFLAMVNVLGVGNGRVGRRSGYDARLRDTAQGLRRKNGQPPPIYLKAAVLQRRPASHPWHPLGAARCAARDRTEPAGRGERASGGWWEGAASRRDVPNGLTAWLGQSRRRRGREAPVANEGAAKVSAVHQTTTTRPGVASAPRASHFPSLT